MNQPGQTALGWPAKKRRFALPALAITLFAILFLYRETAMSMVNMWARSETFTHGFLVPPITLWLIWRVRHSLASMTPRRSVLTIVALGGTGLVWLVSELATVGVVAQFALTTMLVLAVPAILGMQVARRITFPLLFLYFAVPFGEFALPTMMEWTANFTVLGLRLTGIPVYREGLQFIIPSGSWSVVEACSGVRYLIASLTVGTLFAYLTYRSPARRLIFVAISFVVPLLANWMRAYLIVMLGHLSGNKLAVGIDHLIYGWVFFGLVIAIMFWIGSRWREDEFPDLAQVTNLADVPLENGVTNFSWMPVLAVIGLLALFPIANWQIERSMPPPVGQLEALGQIPGWSMSPERLADWSPHFENPSATLEATLSNDKRQVGLYVGYYRNQDSGRKLVSSVNVLVHSSDPRWARVGAGSRVIALGQESLRIKTAELKAAGESRLVVWQWYWINGHLTDSDFVAKAYTALSRLVGRGDDSAVIVIYANKETAGGGDAALDAFAHAALLEIDKMLQRNPGREMTSAHDTRPLVAHVMYRFDVGGLENGVVNLINHMPREAYRHVVISLTEITDFRKRIIHDDVQFIALGKRPGHVLWIYPQLFRLFRNLRPAIVHSRNLAALEVTVPAWAAGVPVRIHGEHGRDVGDLDGSSRKYQWVRRIYRPFVTYFIALSRDLEHYLTGRVGVPQARVAQIYNGVDAQRFHAAGTRQPITACPFSDPSDWLVGTVGRMQTVKNQVALTNAFIRALQIAPELKANLRLVMIGDGPLRAQSLALLEQAGCADRAWLPGERNDVPEILRGLDCFVLPSLAEGISNTILEAMASGLPVIATDVGGNGELIEAGRSGELVPLDDIEAMAQAIVSRARHRERANEEGKVGRLRIEQSFSMAAMVGQYQGLYDRLLGSARDSGESDRRKCRARNDGEISKGEAQIR